MVILRSSFPRIVGGGIESPNVALKEKFVRGEVSSCQGKDIEVGWFLLFCRLTPSTDRPASRPAGHPLFFFLPFPTTTPRLRRGLAAVCSGHAGLHDMDTNRHVCTGPRTSLEGSAASYYAWEMSSAGPGDESTANEVILAECRVWEYEGLKARA